MRRRDEAIEVTCDRDGAPSRFGWRGALWRVLAVENRWVETGSWWTSSSVRAARGEHVADDTLADPSLPDQFLAGQSLAGQSLAERLEHRSPADDGDLLDEITVWRVEVANGLPGSRGVYELAHAPARGQWRLRGVLD